jgi:hypothetical protein
VVGKCDHQIGQIVPLTTGILEHHDSIDDKETPVVDPQRIEPAPHLMKEGRRLDARPYAVGCEIGVSTEGSAAGVPQRGRALDDVRREVDFQARGEAHRSMVQRGTNEMHPSAEREYLVRLMVKHGGDAAEAAQAAGINGTYFHRLMKKHALWRSPV